MIDFENAIDVATKKAKTLIQNANNFTLEGVLLSDDNKLYEVSLSYDIQGADPLARINQVKSGLAQLSYLIGYRRENKVFFVDSNSGEFRGFKNQSNG